MIDWSSKGIDLGRYAGRTSGYVKVKCPQCTETRHNKADKSLSCNVETGAFKCHHCGWQGYATVTTEEEKQAWMREQPWFREYAKKRTEQPKRSYERPPKPRTSKIDPKVVAWFKGRGISEQTLTELGVTSGTDWMPANRGHRRPDGGNCTTIHFNYYRDGELVAVKLRAGDKCFRQQKAGCEQIAYNLDNIKLTEDCYIVEGEIDALSLAEIGYKNVVSVPDGGSDKTMHWLTDYYEEYFANKQTIYICSDNDRVGSDMMNELQKHFDPGQYVIVSDYGTDPATGKANKDANDCLMTLGAEALRKCLANGRTVRPEGDADMERLGVELDELYLHGLPHGTSLGFPNLDELVRVQKGRLVIITGTPGSGKSQFLDHVAVKMNVLEGWRFSMFSPEMMPLTLHMAMLVSKFTGKSFNQYALPEADYRRAKERVQDAIHFIDPDNYDLDGILAIARYQVRKYGCDALIIDPWNDLTMNGEGITRTDDINTALLKILTFAQKQDIVVFCMAHPAKIGRNKDGSTPEPTLSDISGSIHFYNRADIGIVLVRVNEDGREYTKIKVQKMRFGNLGKVGEGYLKYQVGVGRFHPYDVVTDSTAWDEGDYLTRESAQRNIELLRNEGDGQSEGNVAGFLAQAEREERRTENGKRHTESTESTEKNDNENLFEDDGDAPF